jgi:hypothetical protein
MRLWRVLAASLAVLAARGGGSGPLVITLPISGYRTALTRTARPFTLTASQDDDEDRRTAADEMRGAFTGPFYNQHAT